MPREHAGLLALRQGCRELVGWRSRLHPVKLHVVNSTGQTVCRHIVHIRGTYEDKNFIHIVMELCSGGELFDRIAEAGHFSERRAAEVRLPVCRASRPYGGRTRSSVAMPYSLRVGRECTVDCKDNILWIYRVGTVTAGAG